MSLSSRRAWIEIIMFNARDFSRKESLSSRRAWIEMSTKTAGILLSAVALLTESVDWNKHKLALTTDDHESLSSRRAWIEINIKNRYRVALHRRSPHGERGLKSKSATGVDDYTAVALLTESVDWNFS